MSKQAQLKKGNEDLFLNIYKIGDIYITTNSENPADRFGGRWEQIKDKFLLCAGSTYSAGSIGGEAMHTLTVNEIPSHTHGEFGYPIPGYGTSYGITDGTLSGTSNTGNCRNNIYFGRTDGGDCGNQPHNNMPPYLAVYVWKRIA